MSTLFLRLARLLALLALPRRTRKKLTKVFDQIDGKIPHLLANKAAPQTLYTVTATAIARATGVMATPTEVAATALIYDYLKAAIK